MLVTVGCEWVVFIQLFSLIKFRTDGALVWGCQYLHKLISHYN